MLINCPECNKQISNKALSCPNCGYPIRDKPVSRRKSHKRMRLPNGFGQISEIKNRNLRNPFRAMVTVGKDPYGKPVVKPLKPVSYFPTYNDAYAALVEYHKNPADLSPATTVEEIYERWLKRFKEEGGSTTAYTTAWRYCKSTYKMPIKEVRTHHIKYCMFEEKDMLVVRGGIPGSDEPQLAPPSAIPKIKFLWNKLFEYALEYDLVDRNYAISVKIPKNIAKEINSSVKHHISYSKDEMMRLWNNADIPGVDLILIQCYSGWRPNELFSIKISDVDLEGGFFSGGSKTDAGKDRLVPIHSGIRRFVERHIKRSKEMGSEYAFSAMTDSSKRTNYNQFKYTLENIKRELDLDENHKPHDGRKQFITMAKDAGVNEWAIKRVVGHSIRDLTEGVYTDRTPEWLKEEIEKIKIPV